MVRREQRASPQGKRTPQQARSRRTRERILRAAVACFDESGYDETTTASIARRARIAIGTLYGYFSDKRTILLELLQHTVNEISEHVIQGLDPELWRDRDPRQSVRNLVDAVFQARTVNPGMQRILWERYFKDPGFRAAVEANEARVRRAIEGLLTVLRAEGKLLVDDVGTAAFVIYTATEWTTARLMLGGAEPAEVDAAVSATSDMISRFLFAER